MNTSSTHPSSWAINLKIDIDRVVDPQKANRLAQLLFSGSTGVTVAGSTGVPS